jgi:hypothetical protein
MFQSLVAVREVPLEYASDIEFILTGDWIKESVAECC